VAKLFNFEVHTPYRLFFRDTVEAILLTLQDGEIGVFADHAAFTAPVSTGILKIKDKSGQWKEAFTAEGILEVKEHKTVLMIDDAEWPPEIDIDRARESKRRAEETIKSGMFKFETESAKAALKRAEARIRLYEEFVALANKAV
jgi:F-type H+-transporting ATPase subunit epsilon